MLSLLHSQSLSIAISLLGSSCSGTKQKSIFTSRKYQVKLVLDSGSVQNIFCEYADDGLGWDSHFPAFAGLHSQLENMLYLLCLHLGYHSPLRLLLVP